MRERKLPERPAESDSTRSAPEMVSKGVQTGSSGVLNPEKKDIGIRLALKPTKWKKTKRRARYKSNFVKTG